MANPALEARPDFMANAYRPVREALMAAHNEDVDQAVDRLTSYWQIEHDQRVEAWNVEQEVQAREAERIQLEQNQREEEDRQAQEAEAERERKETEKKKPKISDFNEDQLPPSIVAPRPSQYAIQKLTVFEYVELWYFSLEGCAEALRNSRSQADDTYGITTAHDVLALRPVAAVRASRNARADHELSFGEFLQAKNVFLKNLTQAAWPDKHVNALAKFFWNIENHPICNNENGNLIALHYASRIRRRWHDDLKSNPGTVFNISLINETLMNTISFEVNSSIQAKAIRKVSPFALTLELR
ncbi:hypothetical protein JVT61DRAFT_3198 [Boletus reticuloceps]|uniref:Uncharacterized protein n=1 Tax=Boletus reticuloceps TaxID=495285 RepID=A0A8I2YPD2_9AGAM|nr:hypothetical protein JVT61DRAFT_3198 [Boletus reticuloceps]